jgi:formate dehydrogenase subunit beta
VVKKNAVQEAGAAGQEAAADRQKAALRRARAALQNIATDLLTQKAVELVIGYGRCSGGDVVPLFVSRDEEAQGLEWNQHCTYNLVRYLTDPEVAGSVRGLSKGRGKDAGKGIRNDGRTDGKDAGKDNGKNTGKEAAASEPAAGSLAIVVKGCDLKSLVVLQSENQVQRERLTVIGMRCSGVVDQGGQLLAKCTSCPSDVYNLREELCDVVVGEPVQRSEHRNTEKEDPDDRGASYSDVAEIDALDPAGRRTLWDEYFARCLRCYACRNVCPLCYCKECVFDQHNPRWVSPAASVASNRSFHLVRAYHLAGRCVDCGECERACPVGIPLRRINRKAAKVVEESFHFRAGLDPQAKSPLVAFAEGDPQEFIE